MLFSDFALDARLQQAIKAAGYESPTPIQEKTIPIGLEGRDIVGTAQTGTGKTAAFVLPILQRLLTQPLPGKRRQTRALIVTPTRELAEQIHETIRQLAHYTTIRSATVYGGVGMGLQEQALRDGVEIIVACPGRLLDHIEHGRTLDGVDMLVLDEADRMLDMGFLPSVKRILQHLPRSRRSMMFSATFAPELNALAAQMLNKPARVDVGHGTPPKKIAHALYPVPQHLKTAMTLSLLKETNAYSALVFTRTKHRADRVARQIKQAGYKVATLHSNKSQNQRQQALDGFRSGKVQILVATDIAARGLDIATVTHVINYDIPDTPDAYIHRIGRTGRIEHEGDAMTLVTSEDGAIVRDIERTLGKPIERRTINDFDYKSPPPLRESGQNGGMASDAAIGRTLQHSRNIRTPYQNERSARQPTAVMDRPGRLADTGLRRSPLQQGTWRSSRRTPR
ncbi:MAG: DEAD/DEAH box helicase [Chloroflexi bacterium]|nr:DEAD/DEAH box helicase [Chloroflexota bacterium]MCL5273584.1 DEAD/DEAH box helicase [Chloroflexota bacterium]